MEEQKDLPKPQTDLPTPEKEITAKTEPKSSIFKSKFFLLFIAISFLIAFLIGGFILGKNNPTKAPTAQTVYNSPTPSDKTTNWEEYTNIAYNYSFKYPKQILSDGGTKATNNSASVLVDPPGCLGGCLPVFYVNVVSLIKPTRLSYNGYNFNDFDIKNYYESKIGDKIQSPGEAVFTRLQDVNINGYSAEVFEAQSAMKSSKDRRIIINKGEFYYVLGTYYNPQSSDWNITQKIFSSFKFTDSTGEIVNTSPTPTCIPRPKCLDSVPRCMIAETSDMCPPSPTQ